MRVLDHCRRFAKIWSTQLRQANVDEGTARKLNALIVEAQDVAEKIRSGKYNEKPAQLVSYPKYQMKRGLSKTDKKFIEGLQAQWRS